METVLEHWSCTMSNPPMSTNMLQSPKSAQKAAPGLPPALHVRLARDADLKEWE